MTYEKIIVSATDTGGNSVQRTFDNVNPDTTNAQLAAFGSKIAALSANTYAKTDRITRVNCDTTPDPRDKPQATITLASTSQAVSDFEAEIFANAAQEKRVVFTYTGDSVPYAYIPLPEWYIHVCTLGTAGSGQGFLSIRAYPTQGYTAQQYIGNIIVCLPETDNYKGAQAVFTITA